MPEKNTETEINNIPEKEFTALVMKILSKLRKRIGVNSDNFNKTQSEIMNSRMNHNGKNIFKIKYIYIYMCHFNKIYIYIYVCVYIHTHTHTYI